MVSPDACHPQMHYMANTVFCFSALLQIEPILVCDGRSSLSSRPAALLPENHVLSLRAGAGMLATPE